MKLNELTETQLKYAIKKTMRVKAFFSDMKTIITGFMKTFKIHEKQAINLFDWAFCGNINKKIPKNFNVDSVKYS
jgi:hypothetical protein